MKFYRYCKECNAIYSVEDSKCPVCGSNLVEALVLYPSLIEKGEKLLEEKKCKK